MHKSNTTLNLFTMSHVGPNPVDVNVNRSLDVQAGEPNDCTITRCNQRVIGLCGRAGSGKSTAAAWLESEHGFYRLRFAGPLKQMLRSLGLSEQEIEGDKKEVPSDLLLGNTPRQAMQWLGTEWGRNLIGDNFWVHVWGHTADRLSSVVAEDVRFGNEAAEIRSRGGVIVRLECPWSGSVSGGTHESEAADFAPDITVSNDVLGDPSAMFRQLDEVLMNIFHGVAALGDNS